MNRRTALMTLSSLTAATLAALIATRRFAVNEKKSETTNGKMPIIFIGHGSPMNAIEDNTYTQALNRVGQILPQPKAILMISAHWMTNGTWVTHMKDPKTIHDCSSTLGKAKKPPYTECKFCITKTHPSSP